MDYDIDVVNHKEKVFGFTNDMILSSTDYFRKGITVCRITIIGIEPGGFQRPHTNCTVSGDVMSSIEFFGWKYGFICFCLIVECLPVYDRQITVQENFTMPVG